MGARARKSAEVYVVVVTKHHPLRIWMCLSGGVLYHKGEYLLANTLTSFRTN